jgi:hypothetical protein
MVGGATSSQIQPTSVKREMTWTATRSTSRTVGDTSFGGTALGKPPRRGPKSKNAAAAMLMAAMSRLGDTSGSIEME